MRIKSLMLKDFRAFGEERMFHFADPFTVIVGINGRGKTALLDSLAVVISRLLPQVSPGSPQYKRLGPSDIHKRENAIACGLFMQADCAGYPIQFNVEYSLLGSRSHITHLSESVRRTIRDAYGDDPLRSNDAAPLVVYYTVDRAGCRMPKKVPREAPSAQKAAYLGALVNRTIDFRDMAARIRLLQHVDTEDSGSLNRKMYKSFEHVLEVFLPGFGRLQVAEGPSALTVEKNGKPLDLFQLSDGERSFLALGTDLARRLTLANPALGDPLQGRGVVLIDELELHLHPKWQREVTEKLRTTFPNLQFIATTHSPFVIQSLRPGELINLDPEEFGEYADKSIEDIAENVMGVELPQKSERYRQMMDAAETYFRLLRAPRPQEPTIKAAEQKLTELAAPFSDDPAFQALLKLERETQRGGAGDATR